jgi:hypothetical protein
VYEDDDFLLPEGKNDKVNDEPSYSKNQVSASQYSTKPISN